MSAATPSCRVCGAAIQAFTAERTGGLCMPCLAGGKAKCGECGQPMVRQAGLPLDRHVCIPCRKRRPAAATEEIERGGVWMAADWAAQLDAAQKLKTVAIAGKRMPRLRWSSAAAAPCGDCAALPGELHVPGCDVEPCPACGGQLISCGCMDKRKTTKRKDT